MSLLSVRNLVLTKFTSIGAGEDNPVAKGLFNQLSWVKFMVVDGLGDKWPVKME